MLARFASATVIALAALTACQQPETAEQMHSRMQVESDSARVALEAQLASYVTAFNERRADGMAAAYAPNAVLMPPDMPGVTGRDNIRGALEAMFAQTPVGTTMTIQLEAVTANGPVAVERGVWTMTVPTPDGGSSELRGKYLAEWHKIDGTWMMVSDIWNNDAPPPPM